MFKKTKTQSGFTLIELLVVVAIITMFTAISIPSYGAYTRTLYVKGSARDIRSLLWEAQALSLGPKDDAAKAYFVDIDKNDSDSVFELKQDPENTSLRSFASLNRFVSIDSINVDGGASDIGLIRLYFDTGLLSGKSQDAGMIRFKKTDGSDQPGEKITINLKSSASNSKYKVVVDRILGSIIVSSY